MGNNRTTLESKGKIPVRLRNMMDGNNRTTLESKEQSAAAESNPGRSNNRTTLESKEFICIPLRILYIVIIEPHWNLKMVGSSLWIMSTGNNRTTLESKVSIFCK